MDDSTLKRLKRFQEDLSSIVGPELATTIVNFAQRPNELEAEFLRSDGLEGLEPNQRVAVLELIEHYRSGQASRSVDAAYQGRALPVLDQ